MKQFHWQELSDIWYRLYLKWFLYLDVRNGGLESEILLQCHYSRYRHPFLHSIWQILGASTSKHHIHIFNSKNKWLIRLQLGLMEGHFPPFARLYFQCRPWYSIVGKHNLLDRFEPFYLKKNNKLVFVCLSSVLWNCWISFRFLHTSIINLHLPWF